MYKQLSTCFYSRLTNCISLIWFDFECHSEEQTFVFLLYLTQLHSFWSLWLLRDRILLWPWGSEAHIWNRCSAVWDETVHPACHLKLFFARYCAAGEQDLWRSLPRFCEDSDGWATDWKSERKIHSRGTVVSEQLEWSLKSAAGVSCECFPTSVTSSGQCLLSVSLFFLLVTYRQGDGTRETRIYFK